MTGVSAFSRLCRLAGSRLDWIQAGGGNASIKRDSVRMTIKASGVGLSTVTDSVGVVDVDFPQIVDFLSAPRRGGIFEHWALPVMSEGRPSIETYMHAVLGRVVLHVHPWDALPILCDANWKEKLGEIWGADVACVPYCTPGVALGVAVSNLAIDPAIPTAIWLQNHGLIVSGPTEDMVLELMHAVTGTVADVLGIDPLPYRMVTRIQYMIEAKTGEIPVVHWCQTPLFLDVDLVRRASDIGPLFPDQAVFSGTTWPMLSEMATYIEAFGTYPSIIRDGDRVYIAAKSLSRAREIEDVATAQLMAVKLGQSGVSLSPEEVSFLQNWDAEKWRVR